MLSKLLTRNSRNTFLMCPPDFYGVEYEINPWMKGNIHRETGDLARLQWKALHETLTRLGHVELLAPRPGVPDLVFTANAGLVLDNRVVISRFRHPERQREEPFDTEWFRTAGFDVIEMPRTLYFEGAGDGLFLRDSGILVVAHGYRTVPEAASFVADVMGVEVFRMELADPRFYHLDTCFCPLGGGRVLYYPPAFTPRSVAAFEELVPAERRHAVSDQDAAWFACNAVDTGDALVLNNATPELEARLASWGYATVRTPLTEFMLAGGAAKCLTLRLNEPRVIGESVAKKMA